MSVLFPKVPKPRKWDYRPIYYDKEKEARKEKLARLHRGSFREAHEANTYNRKDQTKRKSKLLLWVALLILLIFAFHYLL
ncbi:MAG: hypothetical protein IKT71_02090 [Paludibacteraceae bacterium]|nr:hypothetical protein [Paludibacteraceae bacterium]